MSILIQKVTKEELRALLTSDPQWTKSSGAPLYFVGDVGGTNARLGFGRKGDTAAAQSGGAVVHIAFIHFPMTQKNVTELVGFLQEVAALATEAGCADRITAGALSVPGPISEAGKVAGPFNNLKGLMRLADYPPLLFPEGRSALLNDLQAGGYGIVALSDAGRLSEYFTPLWEGTRWDAEVRRKGLGEPGTTLGRSGACFVAAPGTGLGSSLVYHTLPAAGDAPAGPNDALPLDVLAMEFGSTSVPFRPGMEEYLLGLGKFLFGHIPGSRKARAPIAENACCGGAIIYNYLLEKKKRAGGAGGAAAFTMPASINDTTVTPKDVADLAKAGDPAARAAMLQTYQSLVRSCSEAAMMFLPLTIAFIGDNIVNNGFLFEDPVAVAALKKTVLKHPMQDHHFIEKATFVRQTKLLNINLLGGFGFGTSVAGHRGSAAPAAAPAAKSKL